MKMVSPPYMGKYGIIIFTPAAATNGMRSAASDERPRACSVLRVYGRAIQISE
jgi:hypothetical protein